MHEKKQRAEDICSLVLNHPTAHFYQERVSGNTPSHKNFPPLTRAVLAAHPYKNRIYTDRNEPHWTKIVYGTPAFLMARTHRDLVKEPFGFAESTRPLVAMIEREESMEKGVYFYERNTLAFLAHDLPEVTKVAAQRYAVDSFITNMRGAELYLPFVAQLPSLKHIRVLDARFDMQTLSAAAPVPLSIQLYIPEYGSIAEACPESLSKQKILFHVLEDTLLETGPETYATKLFLTPTPLIRYSIGIHTEKAPARCSCQHNEDSFYIVAYEK